MALLIIIKLHVSPPHQFYSAQSWVFTHSENCHLPYPFQSIWCAMCPFSLFSSVLSFFSLSWCSQVPSLIGQIRHHVFSDCALWVSNPRRSGSQKVPALRDFLSAGWQPLETESWTAEKVLAPYRNLSCPACGTALWEHFQKKTTHALPIQTQETQKINTICFFRWVPWSSQCFGVASEHESSILTGFGWDSKELWVPEKASCAVGTLERAGALAGSCMEACALSCSSFFPLSTWHLLEIIKNPKIYFRKQKI